MDLKTPIVEVTGIGESHAKLLHTLGIETIEDLLWHLPRRWDDYSNILPIKQIKPGVAVSVRGKVAQIENKLIRGGKYITQALISDGTGLLKAVWFNQPFLTKNIHIDDDIFLAGVVEFSFGSIQMQSPSYELIVEPESSATHVGRIVPVYPETAGVTSRWLRNKIMPLMKYMYSIKDYLPEDIKTEEKLIDLPAAVRQMHFPENTDQLEKARERIDFDEMFLLQAAVLGSKKELKKERAIAVAFDEELIKNFVQSLGYELTNAQRKAAWDILKDIAKGEPMNRLLQGDVGSGKTIVAAIAMLDVAAAGSQAAILCPTEILAKQHFAKLSTLLKPFDIECVLLTGSTPKDERIDILTRIRDGEIKVIVGTHAILEKKVEFWRLALAIVDEQHRFGVDQRAALKKESLDASTIPHFLAMTATPIPRTLSLTVYGDLDVSIIYELPPGRQRVVTRIVPEEKRLDSYEFIRKEVDSGKQVFVVCPLVQDKEVDTIDSEAINLIWNKSETKQTGTELSENERKSVMSEYEKLSKKVFPGIKVDYIHGQMKTAEKELAMSRFISGETKILVSSSVIEVGVDVPNATIIMIEDADRFGLSQLHQFRGRVGRGLSQSYCLLFSKTKNELSLKRLEALVHTDNGFKLADADLEIRGPGDFIGGRQHGLPDISMRNLMNTELITRCREAAKRFYTNHDISEYPLLQAKTAKYNSVLTLE
jgi:ATP-dependent DNA helicase RecG